MQKKEHKYLTDEVIEILKDKKVLLFDYDGTIIPANVDYGIKQKIYNELGLPFNKEIYKRMLGEDGIEYILHLEKAILKQNKQTKQVFTTKQKEIEEAEDIKENIIRRKAKRLYSDMKFRMQANVETLYKMNIKCLANLYHETLKESIEHGKIECLPYIKELFEEFPDKRCFIVTANTEEAILGNLSRLGLENYFKDENGKVRVISCAKGKTKQNVYIDIETIVGESRYDCVVLEDRDTYLRQANALGLPTIGIKHEANGEKIEKADYIDCVIDTTSTKTETKRVGGKLNELS